ncbi:MAG: NAD(P)H-dependent oxidoreductase subunit E [Anaerolineales bacterium]|nr:NAD(P)H-dependent oxidoreductase subunit E [Anaerolineales bacterium]
MTNKTATYRPIDPEIAALVEQHGTDAEAVLEILTGLQEKRGVLSSNDLTDVGRALHIPPQKVFGVASFYSMLSLAPRPRKILRVCDGPVCWLCGGEQTRGEIDAALSANSDWVVERTSCLGLCDRAPAVLVNDEQAGPIDPKSAGGLFVNYRGKDTDYRMPRHGEMRVMLAGIDKIDPDSLESALAQGGYQGLQSALNRDPEAVIQEVEKAGLTGRGGAGFPVGRKWRFVAQAKRSPKVIICNADESEPLIFKDRVLIDTNPHQILEGMAVAGFACGAETGYIYIRGEYQKQAERLERAIHAAENAGWLGRKIHGSDFSFHIHVHRGAGAYICGEETALIESLEGHRGEPRTRPPYPPTAGYHQLPTLVNNVESYAAVRSIMKDGAEWYRSLSSAATPGTKLYMILGHVNNPGLFEAPFGLTLRQVIDQFGGGMRPGSEFHFALTGGAAGTIVSAQHLDIPVDYASAANGIALGAGAFLICDQSASVVAFLANLLDFFRLESCGKCTPCRVGTHRAHEIVSMLAAGSGHPGAVDELHQLADVMYSSSFCGLGQSVPIPMRSALQNFTADFLAAEKQIEVSI